MTLFVVRTVWSGFNGAPGLSQHAFEVAGGATPSDSDASHAATAVRALWTGITAAIPPVIKLDIQSEVDTFDEATGDLTGTVSAGTQAQISGSSGATVFANGVGMRVKWLTGSIAFGRRITGSTFIVPVGNTAYDTDGSLTAGTVTALTTAGSALLSSASGSGCAFGIWSKPNAVKARPGFFTAVSSAQGIDKISWLRGRRT